MTSKEHVVIDVSSDEEDDKLVDFSILLDGVLEVLDGKPKIDLYQKSSNSSDPTVEIEVNDDDCVILDDDPYKTTEKETGIDTCDTDEVLVVGQKGEIACRDFPHPRHACAKYPFKSTSHEQYCEMCHCYVCDSRAPCAYWFNGYTTIDHCHANDKEHIWKAQRESIRVGKMLPGSVPKPCLTIPQPQRVTQPPYIPMPQNLSSPLNKFGIRLCSTATRVAATHPNTYTRHGHRTDQSRTLPRNPCLQPQAAHVPFKPRSGSNNRNPNPLAVSSRPFKSTPRPSRGAYHPANSNHKVAQGSQYTCNALPTPLQGNPQRTGTGLISTVPDSHNKVYPRDYYRNMYSGNVQTNTVPSETPPNPPANQQQQQQSGICSDKVVLSEFEDWLMDNSTMNPLPSHDNDMTFSFDFETFLD